MALDSWVGEYLVVIAAYEGLVSEEVNLVILAFFHKIQGECLIPAGRKHVERYLAADGKSKIKIFEFFSHGFHHIFSNVVLQVIHFVLVPLLSAAISADRRNVQHSCPELYEGASFNRDIQVSYVMESEVDNLLDIFFAKVSMNSYINIS